MRRRLRAGITGFVACCLLLLLTWDRGSAQAGHMSGATGFLGCEGINMADNRDHTVWLSNSVLSDMRMAVGWSRVEVIDPTVINTEPRSDFTSLTDVLTYEGAYNGRTICGVSWSGYSGATFCNRVLGNKRCEQHTVYFNNDVVRLFVISQRRWLACHELGHSLGLNHRNAATCIRQEPYSVSLLYDQHDRDSFFNSYL